MTDHDFPVDDATLVMLAAACELNPDTGRTHLHDFLDMGTRIKTSTDISDQFDEDGPLVYFVEHEEGYEPFSEYGVIRALVAEIQRLRAATEAPA